MNGLAWASREREREREVREKKEDSKRLKLPFYLYDDNSGTGNRIEINQ